MRLNPDYRLHKLGRHYMIVDRCEDNTNFANIYSLSEVAGKLWIDVMDQDFTADDLVDILCRDYEVDRIRAAADIKILIQKWVDAGFII